MIFKPTLDSSSKLLFMTGLIISAMSTSTVLGGSGGDIGGTIANAFDPNQNGKNEEAKMKVTMNNESNNVISPRPSSFLP